MKGVIRTKNWYSIEFCQKYPNYLFVFGDNTIGKGMGGQAIIRHQPNAYGIPTKKLPSSSYNSFFSDNDYDKNVAIIKKAIDDMPIDEYDYIVFPDAGLGTGLAELPKRAPSTYRFLVNYINEKFGEIY